ncbi:MAG: anti-sigma B factor antagonist [Verrucomicrobia bacterium]|nr:anti-sigma B factor antagonist [Verrucomicrobiota bacterium]
MNIELKEQDGIKIVQVTGDIDSKTAAETQEKLVPLVEQHKTLILDMTGVAFMSSAGLRTMLLLYRHATAANGKLALVGLSDQIKDTMAATGFLRFFAVCKDTGEAVAALRK